MAFQRNKASLIGVILVLGGCASAPPPRVTGVPSADLVERMRLEGITSPSSLPIKLRTQTKGKVVAATAAKTVASLFAGGYTTIRQRNPVPPGGYTDTDSLPSAFGPAESLAYSEPTSATAEALRRKLGLHGVTVRSDGKFSLQAVASFWGVDYEKLSEQDNYRVYYNVVIKVRDDKGTVLESPCLGATKKTASVDRWLAGDEAEVRRAATAIGSHCANRFLSDLGLLESEGLTSSEGGERHAR